jgi:hypothetical protein
MPGGARSVARHIVVLRRQLRRHFIPDKRARLIAQEVSPGPSPEPHLYAIRQYIEGGFDHLILTQIGSEQDPFVQFFKRELRHTILS